MALGSLGTSSRAWGSSSIPALGAVTAIKGTALSPDWPGCPAPEPGCISLCVPSLPGAAAPLELRKRKNSLGGLKVCPCINRQELLVSQNSLRVSRLPWHESTLCTNWGLEGWTKNLLKHENLTFGKISPQTHPSGSQ